MNHKKKTPIDEALLDLANIQETLKNNTKEILRSTMREEINQIVAESMKLNEYHEEDVNDVEVDTPMVDAPVDDVPAMDAPPAIEPIVDAPIIDEPIGSDFDMVDMTNASDDEVVSVFKKLSGEDEIEIVSDTEIKLNVSEPGEYTIKTGGNDTPPMDEPAMDAPIDTDGDGVTDADELADGTDVNDPTDFNPDSVTLPKGGDEEGEEITDIEIEDVDESKIYEIAMNETAIPNAYDVGPDASLPTGDIEGQKPSGEKEYAAGDNLTGGFGEQDAKNGTGDAHAEHVMGAEGKTDPSDIGTVDKTNKPAEEDVNGSGYKPDEVMKESANDEMSNAFGTKEWGDRAADDEAKRDALASKAEPSHPDDEKDLDEQIDQNEAAARRVGSHPDIVGPGAKGKGKNESVEKYNALLREAKKLKKENDNFKVVLEQFRGQLTDTIVYSQNLTNVTRLFTEHTTTKEEKENIIKRFDKEVTNTNESKKLYKIINNELSSKGSIVESVDKTLNTQTKVNSGNKMNESTIYGDPGVAAIRKLMDDVSSR